MGLHIHENDVRITLSGSDPPSLTHIEKHEYNENHEQYIIILTTSLEKDKIYEINIEYSQSTPISADNGYLFHYYVSDLPTYER